MKQISRTDFPDLSARVGKATVDPATGIIYRPLSPYVLSIEDVRQILFATDILVADCLADLGYSYPVYDRRPLNLQTSPDRSFGVWTENWATHWGYNLPPPTELHEALMRIIEELPSEVHAKALPDCQASASAKMAADRIGHLGQVAEIVARVEAESDPRWSRTIRDWSRCMAEGGVSVSGWTPSDLPTLSDEEQKSVATLDVQCKVRTDLVQKLAGVEAAYQEVILERHRAMLDGELAAIEHTLEASAEVIGEWDRRN